MTALYPSTHGCVHVDDVLGDDFETLAERLYAEGVLTAAVQSDGALNMQSGAAQGFEHYDEEIASSNNERDDVSAAALFPLVTAKGLAWLEEQADCEDPWLLWLHYASPWPGFTWVDPPADPVGVASAADEAFGRLLDGLEELGLAQGTLVVLIGIHGGREVAQVPFLVRGLDLPPSRVATPVGTVDLAPTLLELYQLEFSAPPQGRSLVGGLLDIAVERGPVLARGDTVQGVAHEGWLFLADRNRLWTRLHDLSADPGRTLDLKAERPELAVELEADLEGLLLDLRSGRLE
jgi:arylsulfatase A-like enzyme